MLFALLAAISTRRWAVFERNTRTIVFERNTRTIVCAVSEGPAIPTALVRVDKLLAERGVGSRKDADRLIRAGEVEIDGEVLGKSDAKRKVSWECTPIVCGEPYAPPPLLAAYHKPVGVFSTMRDERGRPSLSHVLPESWRKQMHPIGRLDADTSGLLLFSRDGALTHKLLHPKYEVEREYVAKVDGEVDKIALANTLKKGVATIEDGEEYMVYAKLLDASAHTVRIQVAEGKYRMVRRMLANCGHPVVALHRVRYGQVLLGELPEGESCAVEGAAQAWAESVGRIPSDPAIHD
eukprot:CAMPEP_0183333620 /NCGR_PEP_ID=MMETSP0164_2-20130417/2495_1 /TAXON_ID=221442 /ORGANISM="Coccolithus pelagicus ssp braarudi, Strain PLY182g" /LENGTH=293 /DNA_ID=CAMNT_0025502609 /DNA_START=22 /DNA_END=903 /DNA_ORIENTATION=-